ncbi:hypothetical protein BOTCAL_0193g00100 [Botryotinia calthae]|uniref:Uncharacterized protein n=1 Tax=Botryotinia calthae TaxID=38488 RepID=A0A4Y8D0C5_9HELO|nr:hypothetical protein BOTCAL_0193g00100 [Botryotinia calthae]
MPTQSCEETSLSKIPFRSFNTKPQIFLLDLPEEVQSSIYRFSITRSEPLIVAKKHETSTRFVADIDLLLRLNNLYFYKYHMCQSLPELTTFTSISLVCRKTHRIVAGNRLVFKSNHFDMRDLNFFARIGKYNTAGIISVTFRWIDSLGGETEEEYLRQIRAECPNLEHLRLLSSESFFGKPEKPAGDSPEPYLCRIPIKVTGELFAFRGLKSFEYKFDTLERKFRVWLAIQMQKFWREAYPACIFPDLEHLSNGQINLIVLQSSLFRNHHELLHREILQKSLSTYVESLVKLPRNKDFNKMEIATPVTHYLEFDAKPIIREVCDNVRMALIIFRQSITK